MQDICAILCGLVIAQDYRRGQRMLTDRNFKDNAQFFQVGRDLLPPVLHAAAVKCHTPSCASSKVLPLLMNSVLCCLQDAFEVGRRFRIMNPDRMRSTYGMLIYMLMDSAEPQIQDLLEFQCVRPLRTVYSLLGTG
jgi:Protein of unknown function (DUF2009)